MPSSSSSAPSGRHHNLEAARAVKDFYEREQREYRACFMAMLVNHGSILREWLQSKGLADHIIDELLL